MKKNVIIALVIGLTLTSSIVIFNSKKVSAVANASTNTSTSTSTSTDNKIESLVPENMNEKESIQYKMLNSIDYFDSAIGSFEYFIKDNTDEITEFAVDIKNTSSYTKTYQVSNPEDSTEDIVNSGKLKTFFNKDKTVRPSGIAEINRDRENKLKKSKPKDRYVTESDGKKSYIYRDDPTYMGTAASVLFNQNIALGLLEDSNLWNISGKENYLNIETVKVSGKLNEYYSTKLKGDTFTLLVDPNTGILLKLEVKNSVDNITYSIVTKQISLNTKIDKVKFEKDPKEYKEIKIKAYGEE